jgi:hypothetical protein
MRLKEQRLYDSLKRNVPRGWWLQRIENVMEAGMPDVLVTMPGRQAWVELKSPRAKKRGTSLLLGTEGLSIAQINWHSKAVALDVLAYILVRPADTSELFLIESGHAPDVNEWSVADAEAHRIAASWDQVMQALRL